MNRLKHIFDSTSNQETDTATNNDHDEGLISESKMAHKFSCINSVLQDYFSGKGNVNDGLTPALSRYLRKNHRKFIYLLK